MTIRNNEKQLESINFLNKNVKNTCFRYCTNDDKIELHVATFNNEYYSKSEKDVNFESVAYLLGSICLMSLGIGLMIYNLKYHFDEYASIPVVFLAIFMSVPFLSMLDSMSVKNYTNTTYEIVSPNVSQFFTKHYSI
jgi:hypothetical protein